MRPARTGARKRSAERVLRSSRRLRPGALPVESRPRASRPPMIPTFSHRLTGSLLLIAGMGAGQAVHAAAIGSAGELEGLPVISVDGELQAADVAAFKRLAERYPRAIVAFRS